MGYFFTWHKEGEKKQKHRLEHARRGLLVPTIHAKCLILRGPFCLQSIHTLLSIFLNPAAISCLRVQPPWHCYSIVCMAMRNAKDIRLMLIV